MSNKCNNIVSIAIVGVGALFASSNNAREFWRNIYNGRDLCGDVPPGHWRIDDYYDPDPKACDKTYSKRGSFLGAVKFDPAEYKIPPNALSATDTSQLLALVVAKELLLDTFRQSFSDYDLKKASVVLGATGGQELLLTVASRMERPVWLNALRKHGVDEELAQQVCATISDSYVPWQENTFPGLLGNVIAGRITNYFDFGGTNCAVDAACASSLAAIDMAIDKLQTGQSDLVISGGVDTMQNITMYMCFSKTPALSKTGDCRPLSDDADGTLLGEGLCLLALKRLEDAERDGNAIYAVIRGIGSSSDGRGKSIYAPSSAGQAVALRRAYAMAGYAPDAVELVEAHGTGTKAGDAVEFEALRQVFSEDCTSKKKQWCALGSVKSQIGHTKAAAGAAGMFKAALALQHKVFPPTIKVQKPNRAFNIEESPFYLSTKLRPWVHASHHPRRASVSAFGFGGSNFHVTLEEYLGPGKKALRVWESPTELIVFSANSKDELLETCKNLLQSDDQPREFLSWLARSTQENALAEHGFRLAIVAQDVSDLRAKLKTAIDAILSAEGDGTVLRFPGIVYAKTTKSAGKIAFLFPGQGSQYVNMGADLTIAFDQVLKCWDEAAGLFSHEEKTLPEVVFPIPAFSSEEFDRQEEMLKQTHFAQPAIINTSLALYELLDALQIKPDYVAGHSAGEMMALYAAGCFSKETLLRMAQKRGELLRDVTANSSSTMFAVVHPADEVIALLKEHEVLAEPANYNSPKQLVVSVSLADVEKLGQLLRKHNIKYKQLPVSAGFHASFVNAACEPFATWLKQQEIHEPLLPVYANVTGCEYAKQIEEINKTLSAQIASPVKFNQTIDALHKDGVHTFIEVGPCDILGNLTKQCLQNNNATVISIDRKKQNGLTGLWLALAEMFVLGLNPKFSILWENYRVPPPAPKNLASNSCVVEITGCNYGKKYPPIDDVLAACPNKCVSIANRFSGLAPIDQEYSNEYESVNSMNTEDNKHKQNKNQHDNIVGWQNLGLHFQAQIAAAHNNYQKIMAESHIAFLNTASNIVKAFANPNAAQDLPSIPLPPALGNVDLQIPNAFAQPQPLASAALPVAPSVASNANMVSSAPVFVPTQPNVAVAGAAPASVFTPDAAPVAAQPKTEATAADTDLEAALISIVAEKTGYPTETLGIDMELEGDLGVDSIKRVEILSELQSRIPGLPTIEADTMGNFKTLRQIITFLKSSNSGGSTDFSGSNQQKKKL